LPEATAEQMAAIQKVWPRNTKGRGTVFRLVVDSQLGAQAGDFLDLPGNNAPGFTIRNCEFTDHRARGLRLMACDGLVEHNVFRRLKHSAITIGAEYGFWREAGWVENVVVRDNDIEDVGRDTSMLKRNAYSKGAINVFARAEKDSPEPVWPGNQKLVIENNTIRDCPAPGIRLLGANEAKVEGNRIENTGYRTGDEGGGQAIEVLHSENVVVGENTIRDVGVEPTRE
jgi:parallel beta-helix repeat protein